MENEGLKKNALATEIVDEHEIHIEEHTRYYLSEYENLSEIERENILKHIAEHSEKLNVSTQKA